MLKPTKRIPSEMQQRYNEVLPDVYADYYGRGIDIDEGQAQCIAWDIVAEEFARETHKDIVRRSNAGENETKLRLLLSRKVGTLIKLFDKADESAPGRNNGKR